MHYAPIPIRVQHHLRQTLKGCTLDNIDSTLLDLYKNCSPKYKDFLIDLYCSRKAELLKIKSVTKNKKQYEYSYRSYLSLYNQNITFGDNLPIEVEIDTEKVTKTASFLNNISYDKWQQAATRSTI